jgi:hypothetical protein
MFVPIAIGTKRWKPTITSGTDTIQTDALNRTKQQEASKNRYKALFVRPPFVSHQLCN